MFTLMDVSDIYSKMFHIKLQLPWVHFALNFFIHGSYIKLALCSRAQAQNVNILPNVKFYDGECKFDLIQRSIIVKILLKGYIKCSSS